MRKAESYLPKGYNNVVPYLVCPDLPGLIKFVQTVFDAKLDSPPMEGPDGEIKHVEFTIGDSHLMAGPSSEQHPAFPCSLYIYVQDTDATYKKAVAAGGKSLMEPKDMFYGDRNGGVVDQWGNQWWIGTHVQDMTNEEIDKAAQEFYAAGSKR